MLKRRSWLGLALAVSFLPGIAQAQNDMVVFAAASLKNALDEIATTWSKDTGKPAPKISYAASSALAKQIENGAPADVFISADLDWMDYLAERKLIKPGSRVNLLGNSIVLIASLLVMLLVALRRLALAANRLWTQRYMQSTIPAP